MALTRIDSYLIDLDSIGGITFDDQASTPTLKVDAATHRVGIGTANPTSLLHVAGNLTVSGTGFLSIPAGTGAQRPSSSLVNGMMRYNTSIGAVEAYVQGQWGALLTPALDYGSVSAGATNSLDYGGVA